MSASVVSSFHPNPVQKDKDSKIIRRSANWHPSIWGDHFLKYASESQEVDIKMDQEVNGLKEEVKRMLCDSSVEIQLIDTIQRLGVSFHFEREISKILEQMLQEIGFKDNDDLHMTSLKFRLLRQQGYNISSDIFKKFTNKDGKFKEDLMNDVEGVLSLYEASHMRFHGELILDEALAFTTAQLKSLASTSLSKTSPFLALQVNHALKQPIWMGLPRVEARHFITFYQQHPSCNQVLLRFAKLDFNILQKQHQKELSELSRWWKDLNCAPKLSFVRDRLVENYLVAIGVYFEPQYALGRKIMTKVISMMTVLDDMYDVYGTLEELTLFTEAFERWNIKCLDDYPQLPEYMKYFYPILLHVYDEEIGKDIKADGREHGFYYLKEDLKAQVQAIFTEAKWFYKNYTPTYEEYMKLSFISCGNPILITTSFVGMGDIATEEAFLWASKHPNLIKASSTAGRLIDDIATHKDEQKRGDVSSSVECYMKQYGVSEEETYDVLRQKIVDCLKDINEIFCEPKEMNMHKLVARVLNLTRLVQVIYKEDDAFNSAKGFMKDFITSLFIDPIPELDLSK